MRISWLQLNVYIDLYVVVIARHFIVGSIGWRSMVVVPSLKDVYSMVHVLEYQVPITFQFLNLTLVGGKPLACRIPIMDDVRKIIFFPSGDITGNIEVLLPLPTHVIHRLQSEDMFVNP